MSDEIPAAVTSFVSRARDRLIEGVIRDIAEFPDRTSPEDWPEAMLVTADELRAILEARLSLAPSSR